MESASAVAGGLLRRLNGRTFMREWDCGGPLHPRHDRVSRTSEIPALPNRTRGEAVAGIVKKGMRGLRGARRDASVKACCEFEGTRAPQGWKASVMRRS